MKKVAFFVCCLALLMACNSNTILKKPENLIPKDKMVAILADSYVARSASNTKNINGDRSINYLSYIYENHQIDSATFHSSLQYYSANVSVHEEILKNVQAKIEQQILEVKDLIKANDTLNEKELLNDFKDLENEEFDEELLREED